MGFNYTCSNPGYWRLKAPRTSSLRVGPVAQLGDCHSAHSAHSTRDGGPPVTETPVFSPSVKDGVRTS